MREVLHFKPFLLPAGKGKAKGKGKGKGKGKFAGKGRGGTAKGGKVRGGKGKGSGKGKIFGNISDYSIFYITLKILK